MTLPILTACQKLLSYLEAKDYRLYTEHRQFVERIRWDLFDFNTLEVIRYVKESRKLPRAAWRLNCVE